MASAVAMSPGMDWAAAEPLTPGDKRAIDRQALVARHDIDWPSLGGQIPLGNGNFAFNADGTGLQTVGGNTMSHWCWHSFPLPPGVTPEDIKPWATPDKGRLKGVTTRPPRAIFTWQRENPQPLNLGRIGFINQDDERLTGADAHMVARQLKLWTGLLTSQFIYLGQPVEVQTCVDPQSDTVAVRVKSALLRDGRLKVMLDFPAPAQNVGAWVGDFSRAAGHQTAILRGTGARLELRRTIDDAQYEVVLNGNRFSISRPAAVQPEIENARYGASGGGWTNVTDRVIASLHDHQVITANNASFGDPALQFPKNLEITYRVNGKEKTKSLPENSSWSIGASLHQFVLVPDSDADVIEFACQFRSSATEAIDSTFDGVVRACAASWPAFWNSGGAIDLSASSDPRWVELERRIVLSQYELAAQSAGDNPPAEVALTGTDPWEAKWHFEMIWWHLAHYSLWNRSLLAEKALGIYSRVAPAAEAIARNFNYKGMMWPKSTGPNGYNDGWPPEMALLWRIPHPIFIAELEYRSQPTKATLDKWRDVVLGTAEFMADYPTWNEAASRYDLYPVWPAYEGDNTTLRRNTIFELGYWRVALEWAQQWRVLLGLAREPHWDDVLNHLAPLPMKDGLYIYSADRPDTFAARNIDHIDIIGIAGMLPPFKGLDPAAARRTVEEVGRSWDWDAVWGWDFPWMAMAAARVGDPQLAIEALLNPSGKNHYDERGICTGGPGPYLPGNGGLLYAVAMMAAGWDGAPPGKQTPGFPDDGKWVVKWEGLKMAP